MTARLTLSDKLARAVAQSIVHCLRCGVSRQYALYGPPRACRVGAIEYKWHRWRP